MITTCRARCLAAAWLLCIGLASLRAEPIPSRILFPPYTTRAENVVVSLRDNDAVVSGRYRFCPVPDTPERWLRRPFRLTLQMPVLVPRSMNRFEDIEPLVRPLVGVKGQSYRPEKGLFRYDVLTLPPDTKLAVFFFRIERDDLGGEFEVTMDYHQPVITSDGRALVFYVPFLPSYELYRERLALNPSAYQVTFESPPEQPVRLAGSVSHLEQSGPNLIAVHPVHLEVIAVETTLHGENRAPSIRLPLTTAASK